MGKYAQKSSKNGYLNTKMDNNSEQNFFFRNLNDIIYTFIDIKKMMF